MDIDADIEKRVSLFKFIRDIPYKIALNSEEQDYCCSTKSLMLASLLEREGLQTRQIICDFNWVDMPLPEAVLSLPYMVEETTHQFLQVLIPETEDWINCDPTWDSGMKKCGFEISKWDGLHNTRLAVVPTRIYSPQESLDLIESFKNEGFITRHMAYHHVFYQAINDWLRASRS
ncbi:MAG TPA: hypothetical protein PLE43_02705 [Alphaproteobacteria bacterium]|jgi:hypothetical protein|nr:hypothetical protein [Alphaproteobacteria bacterium]HRK97370.1 hypothetical protein [Alphaproteobacteria bacterium]